MNLLIILLTIPILATGVLLFPLSPKRAGQVNTLAMLATLCTALATIPIVLREGSMVAWEHILRVDALSCLMITLVSCVSLLASFYSVGYWEGQTAEERGSFKKVRGYYALFNLFVFSMLFVCTTDNFGLLWVALEATTLSSAFLVGYYNKKASLEAAWRYLILCSVGITFALIGVILAYASALHVAGSPESALNWTYLLSVADQLDPMMLKLAFVFAVVGFGTKAGLVPLHGWLPDAHSEAPTPVSALLSGVLLKCAIYAIIRFAILVNHGVGEGFAGPIMLAFGLLSVGVVTPFILAQTHIKRLLGYHSIEHVGIITIGLGFGSPLAVFGALFHILNHAMTKALLFFTSGNLALRYQTMSMHNMQGALRVMPGTGAALLIGGLALAGAPPFSIFISEFLIVTAGIQSGNWLAVTLLILFLVIIFAALIHHFSRIALGIPSQPKQGQPSQATGEVNATTVWVLAFPLIAIIVLGWVIPTPLSRLLVDATTLISGGQP